MEALEKKDIEIITISKDEIKKFVTEFEENKASKKYHIILDMLTIDDLEGKDLDCFVKIAKYHYKKNKKSFVVVNEEVSHFDVANDINIVPTVQEAYDIIEMEAIERDLGF